MQHSNPIQIVDRKINEAFECEYVEFEGDVLSFFYLNKIYLDPYQQMIVCHLHTCVDDLRHYGLNVYAIKIERKKILVTFNKDITDRMAISAIRWILEKKYLENQALQNFTAIETPAFLEPPIKRPCIEEINEADKLVESPSTTDPVPDGEDLDVNEWLTLFDLPLAEMNESLNPLPTEQMNVPSESETVMQSEYNPPGFESLPQLNDSNEDGFIRTDTAFNLLLHCEGYRQIKIIEEKNKKGKKEEEEKKKEKEVFQIKFSKFAHNAYRTVYRRFTKTPIKGTSIKPKNLIITFSFTFPSDDSHKFDELRHTIYKRFWDKPIKETKPIELSWPEDMILISDDKEFNEKFNCIAYRVIPSQRWLALEYNNAEFYFKAYTHFNNNRFKNNCNTKNRYRKKLFSLHHNSSSQLSLRFNDERASFSQHLSDFYSRYKLTLPQQLMSAGLDTHSPKEAIPDKNTSRSIVLRGQWKPQKLNHQLKQILGCTACYIGKKSILLQYTFDFKEDFDTQAYKFLEDKKDELFDIITLNENTEKVDLRLEQRNKQFILITLGAETPAELNEKWAYIKEKLCPSLQANTSNTSARNEPPPITHNDTPPIIGSTSFAKAPDRPLTRTEILPHLNPTLYSPLFSTPILPIYTSLQSPNIYPALSPLGFFPPPPNSPLSDADKASPTVKRKRDFNQ